MIPRSALLLGLAGLIPFLWGVATVLSPDLRSAAGGWLGPMYMGSYVILTYGMVILSFMSGVLWGFATKAAGARAALGYALSVLPARWAFFAVNGAADVAGVNLFSWFVGLLILDYIFASKGLAPPWWMALRLMLTGVVLACLAVAIVWG
ncbi:MAG: DUF3429 domain-containing protein [Cypionkella sp.]